MIGLAGCYAITTVTPHETATIRVFGHYGIPNHERIPIGQSFS